MIPEILPSNRSFASIFRYNEKNASEFLGVENFPSANRTDLMNYFNIFGSHSNVKNQVFHCSIALRPGEDVSNEIFKNIAADYMQMMGYGNQPYAMYRHYDKEHQHLHLVSSRVNFEDLKKIKDSNEKYRSMKIADLIEKRYGLFQVERTQGKTMERLSEGAVHQINDVVTKAMQKKPVSLEELQTLMGRNIRSSKISRGVIFFNMSTHGRGRGVASSQLPVFNKKSLMQQLFDNKQERVQGITNEINERLLAILDKSPHSIDTLSKLLGDDIKVIASQRGIVFLPKLSEYWVSSSKLQCFKESSLKQQIAKNFIKWKSNKQMVEEALSKAIGRSHNIREFERELSKEGIQTDIHSNSGGVYGISFSLSGFEFKGSEIDKNYSWAALNRHFDTSVQSEVKKTGKTAKIARQEYEADSWTSDKLTPSIRLGQVSTVEDDWKRRKRRKDKEDESEEKISI
jgi:hypothetical protein